MQAEGECMPALGSPRVLISRLSAIGDTIATLPVACALRAEFPDAYLAWVVEEKSSGIVLDHDCVDDVFVLPRGWFKNPRRASAARRLLRSREVDATLDCQGLTKSALACWLTGARQRIGFRQPRGRELSPWLNNVLVRPTEAHVVANSLELLTPLGIRSPAVAWRLPVDDVSRNRMRQVIAMLGLGEDFAVINPGAAWDSRLWLWDRFGSVARHLGERHRLPSLVVWGSARERQWAQQVVAAAAGHAVLAPSTTLCELAALIDGGRLLLSSDTGPMHMAVALGTPTISLHGTTRAEMSGAYGPPHATIQVQYQAGSSKARRRADNRAMRLITVEMVCDQCDALLSRTRPTARLKAG
jgi:ADP-heptose:LPS heptosyltransferase